MKRALFTLVALLFLPSSALATWSVIAVDRATGRVAIASATCVDRDDQFLMGVQAVVVPGKGVAACQAAVDGTHKNQISGPAHHYVFELYALDGTIDVPAVGQSPALTRAAVDQAMAGTVRAKGSLVGLFKR
ncbi:MAG: hypothetical protein WD690_13400 [Vicinamibacterales bacterium]